MPLPPLLPPFAVDAVIFLDGAIKWTSHLPALTCPLYWVGDGDSLGSTLPSEIEVLGHYSRDKNFSDLSGALRFLPCSGLQIEAYGLLGGRPDHELINLLEALNFVAQGIQTQFNFEGKTLALGRGEHQLKHHGNFSLVSFKANQVTLSGNIAYPLCSQQLRPRSSHGLSNVAKGAFSLQANCELLLYFS